MIRDEQQLEKLQELADIYKKKYPNLVKTDGVAMGFAQSEVAGFSVRTENGILSIACNGMEYMDDADPSKSWAVHYSGTDGNMYMEIIAEEPGNEETVQDFSRKSIQSLERMERLIQSLLKMARLDTGAIAFEKQKCRARDLVEQAVCDLRERAVREGKEIRTEGAKSAVLCCDPGGPRRPSAIL